MTKDEALKLALEALEAHADIGIKADKAITAIKEALMSQSDGAQPEHGWTPERIAGIARLKDAQDKRLAQPEQAEPVTVLPDGSAFAMMSWPLPKDHWLYAEREYSDGEYEPVELGKPILTHELREAVVSAVRYAIRGATNCGKEVDFDPDALVLNAVYALCGPYTSPVATNDTSQERVDKTSEKVHEPVAWPHKYGCRANAFGKCDMGCTTPPQRKPLTDEQLFAIAEIAWRHGWASCRDADYVGEEAEDERWGMVGAEVVQDIAAHGIKGEA